MKHHLNWRIDDIPVVARETDQRGRSIPFRCGRDFIFYALAFHRKPVRHPKDLESLLRGTKVPSWLIFTMFHVKNVPKLLQQNGLQLVINGKAVSSWAQLVLRLAIPVSVSWETVEREVQQAMAANKAISIDISLGWWGLLDHVLFVYGEDDDNFYVLDTHSITGLPYERVHSKLFFMKLPKLEVKKRLKLFSLVWKVVPRGTN